MTAVRHLQPAATLLAYAGPQYSPAERPRMRLDPLDHAIIAQLQDDATISLRTLAARCGSSEPTVRRRVARLRRQDVMRVVAMVDPFKQGYPVIAIINLQVDRRQMDTVIIRATPLQVLQMVKYAYDRGQQRAAEPPRPGAARPRRVRTR